MTDKPFRFPAALMLSMALVPHVSAQALPAAATPVDKASGAKVKKGLFGFAKRLAVIALSMMLGGLGGGSMLAAARSNAGRQARLDRLAKIGAYRRSA